VRIRFGLLGVGSFAVAAGLVVWLATEAGAEAVRPVGTVGTIGVVALVLGLALARPEAIGIALALLGAAYAVILAIDDPPLDNRAVIVAAALLAVGELGYLSLETRAAVTEETGATARRVVWLTALAFLTLAVGSAVLAIVDLLRTGGLAIEAVGVAAAAGAVWLLVVAAREAGDPPAADE
jgi:hypothetical protein